MPRRSIYFALLMGFSALAPAFIEAQTPKPFTAPKDQASWDLQREPLRVRLEKALSRELPDRPKEPRLGLGAGEARRGLVVIPIGVEVPSTGVKELTGTLVLPEGASESHRVPLVLSVGDPKGPSQEVVDKAGLDGRPPAVTLVGFGFATLAIDTADMRLLQAALDAVLVRPELDPTRVGVIGFGRGGILALALMAVDRRVACGVTVIETRDFAGLDSLFDPEVFRQFGRTSLVETLSALCAPRPLSLQVGEALPFRSNSPAKALERAVTGTYKVYGPEGTGLAMNIYGEFPGHDSVSTRLQWMAGLEQLDKHLRPQGPAPLGHDPEPEPALDSRFVDLAERGIAGWSAEMSQRPGAWSWTDGIIACKPGSNEFGWLRAPIEVDDFILKVEWRVPEKGNGGIFLRARPVTWQLPPNGLAKPRLQALGLEWPSRTGLELQAQADPGDANRYSSGSLYRHAAPAANPTRPPGQWNSYTVLARGPRIKVWSNGRQVLDTSLDRYPETLPNPPLRGYIGLQNHGSPTDYRNVKLLRLDDPSDRSDR